MSTALTRSLQRYSFLVVALHSTLLASLTKTRNYNVIKNHSYGEQPLGQF